MSDRKDGHATLSVDRAHGKAGEVAVPGDEIAAGAGDGSRLVASQADREQVLDALKAAFVQGRLAKDEFDLRVGKVLATYAELDALTADIPAALTAAQPLSLPGNRITSGWFNAGPPRARAPVWCLPGRWCWRLTEVLFSVW